MQLRSGQPQFLGQHAPAPRGPSRGATIVPPQSAPQRSSFYAPGPQRAQMSSPASDLPTASARLVRKKQEKRQASVSGIRCDASVAAAAPSCLTRVLPALPEPLRSSYEIVEILGIGTYAVVYHIRDKESGEAFALKVIEKEPMRVRLMTQQVEKECAILEEHIGTPYIVQLVEETQTDKHYFLRCELCKSNLEDICKQRGGLPEDEALVWLRQACLGVKELHASGVIHRDLKPSNLLADANGNLAICDFGFACRLSDNLGGMTGTPEFSAPESRNRGQRHTPQTDVYGLGACLQGFLLGRLPTGPHDMPIDLSSDVRDLLQEMMHTDPDCRPTIDELLASELLADSFFSRFAGAWQSLFGM